MRRRRDRGHPWLFMLSAGVAGASLAAGDVFLFAVMVLFAGWLVLR